MKRDLYCGEIQKEHVGKNVALAGWVDRRRDLGSLTFIELRDRSGTVQIVFNAQVNEEAHRLAKDLRPEYVIAVEGRVTERSAQTVNPNIPTGEIEVAATGLKVLNEARTPPFPIDDNVNIGDDLRLKNRYIDLRRPRMQKNIRIRHQSILEARNFLDEQGFYEIETPMLTRSTPEGARDYLVPSRVNPGKFYALPQSPQLFKQILMVSGFDKYFQIVRCFRDEDLRADRQPEFTQVDIEMSFVQMDDVIALVEPLIQRMFASAGHKIQLPIQRLSYDDAMNRYGSDKPDLRFGAELQDITSIAKNTEFRIFQQAATIKGMVAKNCGQYSRKQIDLLEAKVKELGGSGLLWIKKSNGAFQSPMLKSVGEAKVAEIWNQVGAAESDLLLIAAGPQESTNLVLGQLRLHLARQEKWYEPGQFALSWIIQFPMFEFDTEEKRYVARHHPFTSPMPEWLDRLSEDPAAAKAQAYDIVCNGFEIGGGSIRIHDARVQTKVFKVLGISEQEAFAKFGFLLEALQFGAPPHGGIALGVDRIAMLLAGEESIREVIAFPKTSRAQCLMTDSPSEVSKKQLEELHIRLIDDEGSR
jgi:aspartyl-tRNA synthetase